MSDYGSASETEDRVAHKLASPPESSRAGTGAGDASPSVLSPRRLSPRLMTTLTVVGFAIPVVAYLAFIQHYQVNAVVGDQWDDVSVIRASFQHFPDWSSLWSPHTDNRILFPNLIVVGLARTVNFNITVEEYLSAL